MQFLDVTGAWTTGYETQLELCIARCLQGEEAAYHALYRQFANSVYRLNYSFLQDVQDAEEVLQDSFEYAFRQLKTFDPQKSSFKTWLYRIAVSRCHNKRRRKWLNSFSLSRLLHEEEELIDYDTPSPDEHFAINQDQQQVWTALQELSPKLREVAILRYYDGLRYSEVGEVLGISAKTAESRMRLAHQRLRELLSICGS